MMFSIKKPELLGFYTEDISESSCKLIAEPLHLYCKRIHMPDKEVDDFDA